MDQQFHGTRPQPRDTKLFPLWFKAWLGVCLIGSCALGCLVVWALTAVINQCGGA